MPVEVMQLKQKLMSKYPNTVEIAALLSKNPRLNSLFIQIANLNIGKDREEIKSAKGAIDILGLEEVERLFISAGVVNAIVITRTEAEFLLRGIKIGIAAAEFSHWIHEIDRAEAYMAGLLSEVGGIILNRKIEGYIFKDYKNYLSKPYSTAKHDLEHYKTDIPAISSLLCKKWGVNPIVTKAVLLQNRKLKPMAHDTDSKKLVLLTGLIGLSRATLCEVEDSTYVTDEFRTLRTEANKLIGDIPSNATKAAISAISVYGDKIKVTEMMGKTTEIAS